jgi:PAS domain S-box-containing protein
MSEISLSSQGGPAAPHRWDLALEAAGMGEFEWRAGQDVMLVSERMARLTGLPAGPLAGGAEAWRQVIHPEDRETQAAQVAEQLERRGRYEVVYRIVRPDDGRTVWMRGAGIFERGQNGASDRVVGVVENITEQKLAEQQRETLVAELDHRVKNVLASVQSLAAQSARKTVSVPEFLKGFAGRLEAMASAHTLLTATRWRGGDIGHIAAAELGGLAPGQARWEGPEIVLNARATNSLTLALHELATNAVKFGALSNDAGRVEVRWQARTGGGFELIWTERGGPSVAPPTRRGFGSTLLERVTGRELGGEAQLEFRPDGVRATLRADATALAKVAPGVAEAGTVPAHKANAATEHAAAGASAGAPQAAQGGVAGLRVLIVEDAMLLAVELESGLIEAGAVVVGCASNVEEGLEQAQGEFDVALLDVNLNGEVVTPVATLLATRGIPFIFATGYGDAAPAPEGFDAPVVRKPYNVGQIALALAEATGRT